MGATPHSFGMADIKWFEARYDGRCQNDGEPFMAGDFIGYDGDIIIAQDCCGGEAQPINARPENKKPCPVCFQVTARNGACGCDE